MKKSKKAILNALKEIKKGSKIEALVLNMVLQKVDSDSFDFDGDAVYSNDGKRIIYCMSNKTSFAVRDGVEVIGEMAFRSKKKLKSVSLPPSVKTIEKDAFYDCDDLDNVVIPASVSTVRGYSFSECDSLKTVTFLGIPTHLGRHTFSDSDNLHKIIIPQGATEIFAKALNYDADENFLFETIDSADDSKD